MYALDDELLNWVSVQIVFMSITLWQYDASYQESIRK